MILTAFKQHTEMKKGKEAKEYLPTYLKGITCKKIKL
jgi:hypothetical protein